MKFAALSMKQAVIAGVLVAGSVASLVLLAPGLFGREGADDTDVAGSQATRNPSELAATVASPTAPADDATSDQPAQPSGSAPSFTGDASSEPARGSLNGGGNGNAGGGAPPPGGGTPPAGEGRRPGSNTPEDFEIKGDVASVLYPTVANDLEVTIENPHSFAIVVTTASVTVGNAGACSGRHLSVDGQQPSAAGAVGLPAGQRVPARGEVTYTVPARLENSAGDECRQASFPLTYTAQAAKA